MDVSEELYDAHARERLVAEPPKRVEAPERTAFERDRARVVHAAAFRRLAGKTQVVGPETDDFVRNRLTHSLEVAQVARDVSRALGSQPDIAETAALAHDLGHPPFGHNGERALAELSGACGGFEGNAQTLRLLTRLEAKTVDADGRSAGLNLTRATLDACTKYPWPRDHAGSESVAQKFGFYDDDKPVFGWLRDGAPGTHQCLEAQIMDFADDVAYSVHDVEDGVVAAPRRPHADRPAGGLGHGPALVPPRRHRRPAGRGAGRPAHPGQLAHRAQRRQPGGARRTQEPDERPDRPLLRSRPARDVRCRSRAVHPLRGRPRRPGGDSARDRRAQGRGRALRDAGPGPRST